MQTPTYPNIMPSVSNNATTSTKPITLEAYLTIQDPSTKSWKKRYVKLNGSRLEFYVTKKDPDTLSVVNLSGCKVKLAKLEGYMQVLHLQEPTGTEHFMYASPHPETLLWKDALTLAINQSATPQTTTTTTTTSPSNTNSIYSDYTAHVHTNIPTNQRTPTTDTPSNLVEDAYLVQLFFYLVSEGETISDIAKKFGVTVPWIQGCNSLPLDKLTVGSYVIVPFQGELPSSIACNTTLMEAHYNAVLPGKEATADDTLCKICFEKPINTVLLDCGHSALCGNCAQAIAGQPCPFCRRPVSRVVLTYNS